MINIERYIKVIIPTQEGSDGKEFNERNNRKASQIFII